MMDSEHLEGQLALLQGKQLAANSLIFYIQPLPSFDIVPWHIRKGVNEF